MTFSQPRVVAMIPARMGSSRFPGKPLAPILGRPMIEHVYRRTAMCRRLAKTFIATCDEEIASVAEEFGAEAIMTSPEHARASERVAEAALSVSADIIVMVQGDEPMIIPDMIDQALRGILEAPEIGCVNLGKRLRSDSEYLDPNTVKVVTNLLGDALYFSRAPIPTLAARDLAEPYPMKQVCVIPFRRSLLARYAELSPTPLEVAESIDMLRLVENGIRVRIIETEIDTKAVDTEADRVQVEAQLKEDPLTLEYLESPEVAERQ